MNAAEISQLLAKRAEDVAANLLPHGKRAGREWKVGGVDGDKGQSLSVCVSGAKAGTWKDFATGEGGDLLDLFAAVRRQSLADAIKDAKRYLGVRDERIEKPARLYARPSRPQGVKRCQGAVRAWLEARGIADATIDAFRLASEGDDVLVMPYLRDGELVNLKRRNIADKSKQWQAKDAEPCLFGWHLIDPKARKVAITEGEFDAMVLHQAGIPALSVNQGAGNHQWVGSDWERLDQFSEILVCFDADDAGQKGAKEVATKLGIERCRIVTFPAKDANEYLLAGAKPEDFQRCVDDAKTLDPDEITGTIGYLNDVIEEFYPQNSGPQYPCLRVGERQDWFHFRPGEVTVWTGWNGHGKSMILGLVQLGLMDDGEKFIVFSGELPPRKLLARMTRQACGMDNPSVPYIKAVNQWIAQSMWLFNVQGVANSSRMLEVFAYAVRRYGVTHCVVDSLMMLEDVPEDGKGALEAQRQFMVKITAFAKRYGVHVHLVAHPRKGNDETGAPGKQDVAGSGKITNLADNVFSVWAELRDELDEEPEGNPPDSKLELHKQRNGETQHRTLWLWYDKRSQQHTPRKDRRPVRFAEEA